MKIFIMMLVALMSGPTKDAGFEWVYHIPTPEGATDITMHRPHENIQSLHFHVFAEHPSIQVLEFYDGYFLKPDWEYCTSRNEEWISLYMPSDEGDLAVHSRSRYWVSRALRRVAIISIYYESPKEHIKKPSSSKQLVKILIEGNIRDLQDELSYLKLKCGDHAREESPPAK